MSVWNCFPSKMAADRCNETIRKWQAKGYRVAVWRDNGDETVDADGVLFGDYRGYAASVNQLVACILAGDPEAQWIIISGDDIDPDQNADPEAVSAELVAHFGGTFGVMQPTGDRWCEDEHGVSCVDKVAGSAWCGREFCERMYNGHGPLCESYPHYYVDEELQEVAVKLGVFLQRRDLSQYHHHWMRESGVMPSYLQKANDRWNADKRIFESRKADGFPGHTPINA